MVNFFKLLFCPSGVVVTVLQDGASDLPSVAPSTGEASGPNNTGRQKILEFQELKGGSSASLVRPDRRAHTDSCWQSTHKACPNPWHQRAQQCQLLQIHLASSEVAGEGGSQIVTSSWSDSQHVEGHGDRLRNQGLDQVSRTLDASMKQNPAWWK